MCQPILQVNLSSSAQQLQKQSYLREDHGLSQRSLIPPQLLSGILPHQSLTKAWPCLISLQSKGRGQHWVPARVPTSGGGCQQPWEQSCRAPPVILSGRAATALQCTAECSARWIVPRQEKGQHLSQELFLYDFDSQVQQAE